MRGTDMHRAATVRRKRKTWRDNCPPMPTQAVLVGRPMVQPCNLMLNGIQREIYLVGPDAALREFGGWLAQVIRWYLRNPWQQTSHEKKFFDVFYSGDFGLMKGWWLIKDKVFVTFDRLTADRMMTYLSVN